MQRSLALERILQLSLDDAVTGLVESVAEGHASVIHAGTVRFVGQIQRVVAVLERAHRMVQEVISGETECYLLVFRFSEDEVLEGREIGVEESRSMHRWEDVVTVLTWCT